MEFKGNLKVMITGHISTKEVRKDILKGEFNKALIEAAISLESLFFDIFAYKKRLNPKELVNWTLGKFFKEGKKEDLIEKDKHELIADFIELRNLIMHKRYVPINMEEDALKVIDVWEQSLKK